jgi:hypothetical protein
MHISVHCVDGSQGLEENGKRVSATHVIFIGHHFNISRLLRASRHVT